MSSRRRLAARSGLRSRSFIVDLLGDRPSVPKSVVSTATACRRPRDDTSAGSPAPGSIPLARSRARLALPGSAHTSRPHPGSTTAPRPREIERGVVAKALRAAATKRSCRARSGVDIGAPISSRRRCVQPHRRAALVALANSNDNPAKASSQVTWESASPIGTMSSASLRCDFAAEMSPHRAATVASPTRVFAMPGRSPNSRCPFRASSQQWNGPLRGRPVHRLTSPSSESATAALQAPMSRLMETHSSSSACAAA